MKARINGVDLAYDDHGIGQPLLFLHAFPLNRGMWTGITTALLAEQRFRLVTLDWRGFGESDLAVSLSSMELFADDVAGLMDQLGMKQAILCGLSMGGYAALAFLNKYPERVQGLIFADTKPAADTNEARANREQVAQLAEREGSSAIAELQLPKLLSAYTHQHHPEVVQRVRQMIEVATPAGIAAAARGMAQRPDTTALLSTISVPTLVVVGEQDALTPPSVAQEYVAKIAGAQYASIPQAGHLANLEQPEQFLAVVRHFLHAF